MSASISRRFGSTVRWKHTRQPTLCSGLTSRRLNSKHDKIKNDLTDDYTKGSDNYPQTRLQALMLMDHYSKTPPAVTTSEGTAFAQSGKKKKKGGDKEKPRTLIRSGGRTRSVTGVARRDILPQPAPSNCSAIMTISQFAHPSCPVMRWQRSKSP